MSDNPYIFPVEFAAKHRAFKKIYVDRIRYAQEKSHVIHAATHSIYDTGGDVPGVKALQEDLRLCVAHVGKAEDICREYRDMM